MTEKDMQIINILEKDARASAEEISKMTGLEISEVENEIKKLEKKGVIVKYKAVINKDLIQEEDHTVRALIEVKVTPQKNAGFDSVAEKIYNFPEVKNCYLLSGGYDLHLLVEGKNIHEVANFVAQKLAPLDNVQSTATHFLLKKYKEDSVILKKKTSKRLIIS